MAASAYYLSREQFVFSRLLELLKEKWPDAANISLRALDMEDDEANRLALLKVVELLGDEGIASHEALVVRSTQGLQVVGAFLTARGRAALRSAEANELSLDILSYLRPDAAEAKDFNAARSFSDSGRSSR